MNDFRRVTDDCRRVTNGYRGLQTSHRRVTDKYRQVRVLMVLYKSFDSIPHDFLIAKLHTDGFSIDAVSFIHIEKDVIKT